MSTELKPSRKKAREVAVPQDDRAADHAPSAPHADEKTVHAVEAILLSVDRPVPVARLAEVILRPHASRRHDPDELREETPEATPAEKATIDEAVRELNRQYEATSRTFRIEQIAGGYRVMTLPAHADIVAAFKRARMSTKLTRAAVETLAIIAYRQPVTRAELESIRGVACGEVLKSLLDRRLVTIKGRAEELGRPMLYGTTKQFLDQFGLATLKDLPQPAELKPTL
jgi:segregation and condensation protein B